MTDYAPPHSIEAEQALLGALMQDAEQIDRIGELPETAFFREDHRRIYAAIRRQIAASRPTLPVVLLDALGSDADDVGGLAYLGDLFANCVSSRTAPRYAEIVREHAIRRDLLAVGDKVAALANDRSRPAKQALDEAQAAVMGIADKAAFGAREPQLMRDVLAKFLGVLDERMSRDDSDAGISTGFPDLDKRIPGGMDEGWFVVVAGRPGMGKSTLALQIADAWAKSGHGVLVLSQEMPDIQNAERWVSFRAGLSMETLRTGKLTDDDYERVAYLASLLASESFPLTIDDQGALRMEDVVRKCRQVKRKFGLRLVVIDYLQLMVGDGENRTRELTTITGALKALAKELRVTLIALSQLNRSLESRPNRRPIMSDLRESGSIEQDADLVLGIYRDEIYNDDSIFRGLAELSVLKNRSGRPGGFVPLVFNGDKSRFDSMFGEWPQAPAQESPKRKRRGFGDD